LTQSEKFVYDLSRRSFFKLWTHLSPIGKKGKELCDCLIVCGDHIIIISVKEIEYKDTGDVTGFERWMKNAIDKSVSQILGAERWLDKQKIIKCRNGRTISIPTNPKFHRIAVALGGKGETPLKWGSFKGKFVHAFDELSIIPIFTFLDTITDFINFLSQSENIYKREDINIYFAGSGVEDLLALYISNNYSFDPIFKYDGSVSLMLDGNIWNSFSKSDEYLELKKTLEPSYFWDKLIDFFSDDLLTDGMFEFQSKKKTHNELAFIEMAKQPRWYRLNLGEALLEFMFAKEPRIASRLVEGYDNSIFVFLFGESANREQRANELLLRCYVARSLYKEHKIIVGISFDRPGTSEIGYSSEFVYLNMPDWSNIEQTKAKLIQKEFGFFKNPLKKMEF